MPEKTFDKSELRQRLTPLQFQVTQEAGTEPAFTGEYWDCKQAGVYRCVCCGEPLFGSDTKFDSGNIKDLTFSYHLALLSLQIFSAMGA